jgi:hypothetical protein
MNIAGIFLRQLTCDFFKAACNPSGQSSVAKVKILEIVYGIFFNHPEYFTGEQTLACSVKLFLDNRASALSQGLAVNQW